MTLAPLATPNDMVDRGIDIDSTSAAVDVLLASASAEVRDAAGCAIALTTSTVKLVVSDYRCVDLPFGPVASVASVTVNDVAVTGWSKLGDSVIMPSGWTACLPAEVVFTYTHGLPVVPADIVDLVCGMAAMAINQDYGDRILGNVRLGDFAEGYVHAAGAESPAPVALPDSVRLRLRARFGASIGAIAQR